MSRMQHRNDVAAVAFSLVADSSPVTVYRELCGHLANRLRSASIATESVRKEWPVDDTGISGPQFLDEALWHLERAREILRAEASPAPIGEEG